MNEPSNSSNGLQPPIYYIQWPLNYSTWPPKHGVSRRNWRGKGGKINKSLWDPLLTQKREWQNDYSVYGIVANLLRLPSLTLAVNILRGNCSHSASAINPISKKFECLYGHVCSRWPWFKFSLILKTFYSFTKKISSFQLASKKHWQQMKSIFERWTPLRVPRSTLVYRLYSLWRSEGFRLG